LEVVSSNKYHRYNESMRLENETNKAIYLLLLYSFKLALVKKINSAPKEGNKISDDNIGKFILF